MACEYDFDDPVWVNVSAEAKDLIRGLLLDPSQRLSIDAYLVSPWISRGQGAPTSASNQALVLERLSKFGVQHVPRARRGQNRVQQIQCQHLAQPHEE